MLNNILENYRHYNNCQYMNILCSYLDHPENTEMEILESFYFYFNNAIILKELDYYEKGL